MFTVKLTVSLSLYLSHTNTNTHGSSVVFGRFLPLSLTHLSCPTLSLVYYEQNSASFCLRLSFSQYINKYSTKFTRNKYKKVEGVLGVRTRDSWMIGANLFNELWQYLPLFLSHTHSHSRNWKNRRPNAKAHLEAAKIFPRVFAPVLKHRVVVVDFA